MSDAIASQNALDPDRPWITDEEQLPARMNWIDTLINPTGKSPKLHFTRAWTLLFMLQLIIWLGFGFIIGLIGIAGVDTAGLSASHKYLIAITFAVTTLMSFVIHSRRLNHAGKMSFRAIIVLVPLFLGAVMFIGGINGKAAEYQKLYDARAEYLEDPAAWREQRLEERRQAQAEAERRRQEAEAARENGEEGAQPQQRGQRRGPPGGFNNGPSAENPLPSRADFIVTPVLGTFYLPIVGLSALIMLWSLFWVARVPNFGRKEQARHPYEEANAPFG